MRWLFVTVGLLLSCYSVVIAQNGVEATAEVDTSFIRIGEQIALKLSLERPEEVQVQWPFLAEKVGDFDIVNHTSIDSARINGLIKETQTIWITSFDSGYYAIPGLEFIYEENGSEEIARTKGILIEVASVEIDTTSAQLKPIKPIIEVPFSWWEWLYGQRYLFLALLIFIIVVFIFWKLFNKEKKVIPPPPPRPPHLVALEKLKLLEKKKLWQQGEVKTYYSELTEIVRHYIEGRYEVLALESTSDEIISDLKKTDIHNSMIEKIRKMFTLADLAKFAKAQPTLSENQQSLKDAFVIVNHTKQKLVAEAEA